MDCPICEEDVGATAADLIRHTEDRHVLSDAQTQFGGRCEDYPCCGHRNPDGTSDCPVYSDESGFYPYPCIGCGKRIKIGSTDDGGGSICAPCISSGRGLCEGPECPGCRWCMRERDDESEAEEESGED